MAKLRPDFAQVQLTAAGVAFAKGGPLTISNGRSSYTFTPGTSTEVVRGYEWKAWLSRHTLPTGEAMFELAASDLAATAAADGNAPVAAPAKSSVDDSTGALDPKAASSATAQPATAQDPKTSTAAPAAAVTKS